MWQDRRVVNSGYVYARDIDGILGKPGVFRPEHRLVMAQKLGRPLKTSEHVHHIDRNKANNDPANLMLVTASEHAHMHGGKRGPHKQREPLPKFEGRTIAEDLQRIRRGNVICEFRTNAKFMAEFLSRRHRHWVIDDYGKFHE